MPAKPRRNGPQFDAEPMEDDEPTPFVLDDDGNMVLRRTVKGRTPNARKKASAKKHARKRP